MFNKSLSSSSNSSKQYDTQDSGRSVESSKSSNYKESQVFVFTPSQPSQVHAKNIPSSKEPTYASVLSSPPRKVHKPNLTSFQVPNKTYTSVLSSPPRKVHKPNPTSSQVPGSSALFTKKPSYAFVVSSPTKKVTPTEVDCKLPPLLSLPSMIKRKEKNAASPSIAPFKPRPKLNQFGPISHVLP